MIEAVLGLVWLGIALAFLVPASAWQNEVRALMGLGPVEGRRPATVGFLALLSFVALLGLGRPFGQTAPRISAGVKRLLPRRIAALTGISVALLLFWSVLDGVLASARGEFGLTVAWSSRRMRTDCPGVTSMRRRARIGLRIAGLS